MKSSQPETAYGAAWAKEYVHTCEKVMQAAGYRTTMPRIQVIRALSESPTVTQSTYALYEKIIAAGGRIDVVSIYRILQILIELGLAQTVGYADGQFMPMLGDELNPPLLITRNATPNRHRKSFSVQILELKGLPEALEQLGAIIREAYPNATVHTEVVIPKP